MKLKVFIVLIVPLITYHAYIYLTDISKHDINNAIDNYVRKCGTLSTTSVTKDKAINLFSEAAAKAAKEPTDKITSRAMSLYRLQTGQGGLSDITIALPGFIAENLGINLEERAKQIAMKTGIVELKKKEENCKEYAIVEDAERKAKDFSDQALREFEETTNSIKNLILDDFKQFYDSNKLNAEFKLLADAYPKEVIEIETAKIENRESNLEDVSKNKMSSMLLEQKALYDSVTKLNEKYFSENKNYIGSLFTGKSGFLMSQGINPVENAALQIKESRKKLESAKMFLGRLQENVGKIALNECKLISDKDSCVANKNIEISRRYSSEFDRYNVDIQKQNDNIIKYQSIIEDFKSSQSQEKNNEQGVVNEYKKIFNLPINNKVESDDEANTASVTDGQWKEGFGQGNLEYFIDKDGMRLYIGCPTQDGSVDSQSSVSLYKLSNDANIEKFTIDINGTSYDGPFNADSRVGDNNFLLLLDNLRNGDAVVRFNGQSITFPKSNAANVLPVHDLKFNCNLSL